MAHSQFRTPHRTTAIRLLLLPIALWCGLAATGALQPDRAEAAASTAGSGAEKYLGRWNYDQPDRTSMRNVAVIRCPGSDTSCPGSAPVAGAGFSLEVPQIGDIVFAKDAGGGVVGHTDQGCTWRFAVRSHSLELSPAPQSCFNQVIGSSYTITTWSVSVTGGHEKETVAAISHQPTGDCDFLLEHGIRTKVGDNGGPGPTRRFAGNWTYNAADPQSRVNILYSQCTRPDGGKEQHQAPQSGLVTFAKGRDNTITGTTGDGCTWTLAVRGNTALLEPAVQTCRLPDSTVTLKHWSIASDGRQQASVMSGTTERAGTTCNFLLSIGSLTRH